MEKVGRKILKANTMLMFLLLIVGYVILNF